MPNGTYGGVRGRKTKVGRKLLRFPPTFAFAAFRLRSFPFNSNSAIAGHLLLDPGISQRKKTIAQLYAGLSLADLSKNNFWNTA